MKFFKRRSNSARARSVVLRRSVPAHWINPRPHHGRPSKTNWPILDRHFRYPITMPGSWRKLACELSWVETRWHPSQPARLSSAEDQSPFPANRVGTDFSGLGPRSTVELGAIIIVGRNPGKQGVPSHTGGHKNASSTSPSSPIVCWDLLGESVLRRTVGQLRDGGVQLISVLDSGTAQHHGNTQP